MCYYLDKRVIACLAARFAGSAILPLLFAALAEIWAADCLGWPKPLPYAAGLAVAFLAFALPADRVADDEEPIDLKVRAARLAACFLAPAASMAAAFRLTAAAVPQPAWCGYPAAGIAGAAAFAVLAARLFPAPKKPGGFRGRRLIGFGEAKRKAKAELPAGDPGLCWGGLVLPSDRATGNFLVCGTVGSGKTLTISMLKRCVLPTIRPGSGRRALVYDAKRDEMGALFGMGPACPIRTLNPFDARSAAWDIAADVRSPAAAYQVAGILIPPEKYASQQFFLDAARHIAAGVLQGFARTAGGSWTLRDVLVALKSRGRIEEVLSATAETEELLGQYFQVPERIQDIVATIATKIAPFEPIAAAWSHAGEKISLGGWLEEESVLVLGSDEANRSAMEAINRVIFRRLCELILSGPESDGAGTWFFLDEVRQAGCLEGLGGLLTNGRSKGAAVVLGFQDIEGLRDAYGDKAANELTGQCGHLAILRLSSPATARWASDLHGAYEQKERRTSESSSSGAHGKSSGSTVSEQLATRDAVLAAEFMALPPTTEKGGLPGHYVVPGIGAYKTCLPWAWIRERVGRRDPDTPDFVARPDEAQYLRPWSEEDRERLGLDAPAETPPIPKTAEKPTAKPSEQRRGTLGSLKGFGNGE